MGTVPTFQLLSWQLCLNFRCWFPACPNPRKKRGGLDLGQTFPHCKKRNVGHNQQKPPVRSEKVQQISQCTTHLLSGTWNVRTLFRTGSLIMFTQHSLHHKLDITATQTTRWHNEHVSTKMQNFFCCVKEGWKHEYVGAFSVKKKYEIMFLILGYRWREMYSTDRNKIWLIHL